MPKATPNRTQQFRSFLKTDRAILLLCMGIALLFWLFIKLSQEYRTTRVIEVKYEYPESKTFVDNLPNNIIATIKGVGWDLMGNHFSSGKNEIVLELQDQENQTIDRVQIVAAIANQFPSTINVEEVSFNYINVQLDDLSIKKVPIVLEKELDLETGFQLKNITLTPDSVLLKGPAILVDEKFEWRTLTIQLQNLNSNQNLTIDLSPSENEQLIIEPATVDINVEVEQLTEHSFFVPINVINPPDSLNIFPKKIKVSFVVGLSQFDSVKASDIKMVADLRYTSLQAEENTIPVNIVSYPSFIKNVNYSPKSVQFYFVKEGEVTPLR